MKRIILVLFIIVCSFAQAQEIKWMTMDEALAAQKKDPKPIFMDVYTDWCGPCKMLDKITFHDKGIVEMISKAYYAVKFNAEGDSEITYKGVTYANPAFIKDHKGKNSQHDFAKFLKIDSYPKICIFTPEGELINSITGYRSPKELIKNL